MRPAVAATEAQTVLRIETALAKGSLTQVERRDPKLLYHKMTRRELERLSPSFRWKEYFSLAGQPGTAIVECDRAGVLQSDGLDAEERRSRKLEGLPALAPGECERALSLVGVCGRRFRFLRQDPVRRAATQPRWKRCVNYVDNDLGEALGQAYVQRAFPPEAKQRAQKLVKQIEDAMEQDIDGLPWMSPATKQQALEKLHALANKIGYPDKWRDYSALTIARDDDMGNACGPARLSSSVRSRRSASRWTAANGT